jgi:hypothetical protein
MPKRQILIGSLKERYEVQAEAAFDEARRLPPGNERESLERLARRLRIASQLEEWLTSPGLQSPN